MWAQLHTRDSRDISDNDVAEKTGSKNCASLTTAFTATTFTIKILAACHHWWTGIVRALAPYRQGIVWKCFLKTGADKCILNQLVWISLADFYCQHCHYLLLSQLFIEPWVEAVFPGNESVTIMLLYSLTWSWILVAPMVLKRSFSGKLIFFKVMLGGEIKIFHWVEVGELLCCSLLLFQ